jgi:hypothetical protein
MISLLTHTTTKPSLSATAVRWDAKTLYAVLGAVPEPSGAPDPGEPAPAPDDQRRARLWCELAAAKDILGNADRLFAAWSKRLAAKKKELLLRFEDMLADAERQRAATF